MSSELERARQWYRDLVVALSAGDDVSRPAMNAPAFVARHCSAATVAP
jgi:hypothetical protein